MSVGKPYYSDLHPDVKSELTFRSKCSLVDTRSDEQLEWLTSRASWGSITLLSSDRKSVRSAINNKSLLKENNPTKSGNWLGYLGLQDTWNNTRNMFNNFKGQIQTFGQVRSYNATDPDYLAGDYIDSTSGRIKPVLQGINITLRDNATGTQGVLNDATIKVLIPDLEFFQDVFEPQWHRIGIHSVVELGHSVRLDERANYGRFTGAMTNFSFEYQSDATVLVTMQFIAITEIFTEIPGKNVIKSNDQSRSKKTSSDFDPSKQLITKSTLLTEINGLFAKYLPGDSITISDGQSITHVLEPKFERQFINDIDSNSNIITAVGNKTYSLEDIEEYYLKRNDQEFELTDRSIIDAFKKKETEKDDEKDDTSYYSFLSAVRTDFTKTVEELRSEADPNTEENQGTDTGVRYYISLGAIIKLINVHIYAAWKTSIPNIAPSAISVTPEFVSSLYYPELVSADHKSIILPGKETATYVSQSFGVLDTFTENSYEDNPDINFYINKKPRKSSKRRNKKLNLEQDKKIGIVPHIMISTEVLQEVFDRYNSFIKSMDDNEKYKPNEMSISNLLAMLGLIIKENTGHAINLKLSPFPQSNVDNAEAPGLLLYRDVNAIEDDTFNHFQIPMFPTSKRYVSGTANALGKTVSRTEAMYNRQGTVVRSFKLTGQLTTAMKVAAIVGTSKGSRDHAAPLMRYVYADNDEERENTKLDYKEAAEEALQDLRSYKELYALSHRSSTFIELFQQSLKDYIYMPEKTLEKLNKFIRPIAPIDAELTLDGIYGLRFGDVFVLDGLPPRYENFVFYVTKISHSLEKQDWSTTISCQLRVKLK